MRSKFVIHSKEKVPFLQVKEDKHVTSKNSTEKSEQGGLLRKTKTDLKPVFACVVQTISEGGEVFSSAS